MSTKNTWSGEERRLEKREPGPVLQQVRRAAVLEAAPRAGETLAAHGEVLWRRRWTALSVGMIVAGLAAVAVLGMKPVYRAVARVEVNAEAPQMQSLQGVYEQLPTNQEFLRTQLRVLETDQLAWTTIEQLRLGVDERFLGKPAEKMKWRDEVERKMDLIRRFREGLRAELAPGSRVIEVGFEASDPQLAAAAANALVDNYVDSNFEQQVQATRAVSNRMGQQLAELKSAVERSQGALVAYEREHAIYNVNEKQSVTEQRLAELSSDFTAAQADRMQKQALYQQAQGSRADAAALAQDPLLQRLTERLAELRSQRADALAQYGPAFPKAVRAGQQVAQAEATLESERARLVERMRGEYEAAQKRERLLGGALAEQKRQASELNQLLVEHNLLRGEFESNQQLYQRLLQQLKDATVAAGLRATNLHVVDAALPPARPVRPKTALYLALGLLLGGMAGLAGAFVEEAFDSSVKTPEELEAATALPVLGAIPAKDSLQGPRWRRALKRASGDGVALTVARAPGSALAESYRAVRTAVLLSTAGSPPKSILVTSAGPGEGKTTTTLNLAASLAQRGGSVVMISTGRGGSDGLWRDGADGRKGLHEVLSGEQPWEDAVETAGDVPGLKILAAKTDSHLPAELLCSDAMARLLRELGQKFQYVLVDAPPVLAASDATILATMVDGVVLVVESGATPRKIIERSQRRLENAGARLLGAVLNKFDASADGYARFYAARFPAWREEPPPAERLRVN
jgi:succinoglycan biosynthesis transport protein ExoP